MPLAVEIDLPTLKSNVFTWLEFNKSQLTKIKELETNGIFESLAGKQSGKTRERKIKRFTEFFHQRKLMNLLKERADTKTF